MGVGFRRLVGFFGDKRRTKQFNACYTTYNLKSIERWIKGHCEVSITLIGGVLREDDYPVVRASLKAYK